MWMLFQNWTVTYVATKCFPLSRYTLTNYPTSQKCFSCIRVWLQNNEEDFVRLMVGLLRTMALASSVANDQVFGSKENAVTHYGKGSLRDHLITSKLSYRNASLYSTALSLFLSSQTTIRIFWASACAMSNDHGFNFSGSDIVKSTYFSLGNYRKSEFDGNWLGSNLADLALIESNFFSNKIIIY